MRIAKLAVFLIALAGCATQSVALPAPSAAYGIELVDAQKPFAVAGDAGWEYQRTATADFDGDSTRKQAVLIA